MGREFPDVCGSVLGAAGVFEMPILRNDFILNSVSYEDKRFYDKTFYELVISKSSIASWK